MGQRFTITESERNRIKDLYEQATEQKSDLGMKSIDKNKNTFKEVVKYLKSGHHGYKFKEAIRGDESLGVIMQHPHELKQSVVVFVLPDGSWMETNRKGFLKRTGKWNWDGQKATFVKK